MNVMYFHKDTGVIHPRRFTFSDERDVALNAPADHLPLFAHVDHMTQRVALTPLALEDGSASQSIRLVERAPPPAAAPVPAEIRAQALEAIRQLEARQGRALREAALGISGGIERLKRLEADIAGLRRTIQTEAT